MYHLVAMLLLGCLGAGCAMAADSSPLLKVLELFVAPNVPVRGPLEAPPIARTWPEPASLPERPGQGLAAAHDALRR